MTTIRRRNGKTYRRFKGQLGRVYWIEMKPAEVREARLYWLTVTLAPLIMISAFAWAAGMI